MRPAVGWVLVAAFIVGLSVPAYAADRAGTVSRIQGAVIASAGGESRVLRVGAPVFVGDKISTGSRSRFEMEMTDNAVITLGSHTFFTVEAYDATGGPAKLDLIQGVFLAVSGALARIGEDNVTISTPVATIGIRGTTLWGGQEPARLQVALIDGKSISVQSEGGRVILDEPGTGTVVAGPGAPPTEPSRWSTERFDAARATITFD